VHRQKYISCRPTKYTRSIWRQKCFELATETVNGHWGSRRLSVRESQVVGPATEKTDVPTSLYVTTHPLKSLTLLGFTCQKPLDRYFLLMYWNMFHMQHTLNGRNYMYTF